MQQIVTITFFTFKGFKNTWWAFTQMGLRPFKTGVARGLTFAKMLGTGGGNGFSIKPNLNRYAWLAVWDCEDDARDFFKTHALFQSFKAHSTGYSVIYLSPTAAHGRWDGVQPFKVSASFDASARVAVLTRARIKLNFLYRFWKYVPATSAAVDAAEGRQYSIGIGQLPLIEQATFSVWASGKQMMDYAYKSRYHAEVVRKTRELGWYSEELFARFSVLDTEGERIFPS